MSRRTLAAGTVPNDPSNLREWIQTPQMLKPSSLMPDQNLTELDLADTLAYVESLN
jgi:cytochrome c oxidase subunit 2